MQGLSRFRRAAAMAAMALFVVSCAAGPAASSRPTAEPTGAASAAPGTTAPSAAPSDAPSEGASSAPVSGSLSVLEWSGYEDPTYWADFAESYPDVDVTF